MQHSDEGFNIRPLDPVANARTTVMISQPNRALHATRAGDATSTERSKEVDDAVNIGRGPMKTHGREGASQWRQCACEGWNGIEGDDMEQAATW